MTIEKIGGNEFTGRKDTNTKVTETGCNVTFNRQKASGLFRKRGHKLYPWKQPRYKYNSSPSLNTVIVPQKSLPKISMQSHKHLILRWHVSPVRMVICLRAMLAIMAGLLADRRGQVPSGSASDGNARHTRVVPAVECGTWSSRGC